MSDIDREIARIASQGVLGRSAVYERLLRYLAAASERSRLPKEIDIASDVLGKTNFDPANDATVRVYVHNLRQKLNTFYAENEAEGTSRLIIPKGKYQLLLQSLENKPSQEGKRRSNSSSMLAAAAIVLIVTAFFVGRSLPVENDSAQSDYADVPVWQAIVDDLEPVIVVVGDYFIFAEGTDSAPGDRLIRDFAINDSDDYKAWIDANPEFSNRYTDIRLSYLPIGIATALNDVLGILHKTEREIEIVPQSQFHTQMLREAHIIYIGYVSGLGNLDQYLFSASRLTLGASFDELVDIETGTTYVSTAGYVSDTELHYTDYGFVSTFPGPAGNQFLFITGLRDEGLMRMASTLESDSKTRSLDQDRTRDSATPPAFEMLYRVSGVNRTYVAATRLFTSPLDASHIWTE